MTQSQENDKPTRKPPLVVRLSLWGIKSRKVALLFVLISIVLAAMAAFWGYTLLAFYLMFVAAPLYWYSLRWMDKNDRWP